MVQVTVDDLYVIIGRKEAMILQLTRELAALKALATPPVFAAKVAPGDGAEVSQTEAEAE